MDTATVGRPLVRAPRRPPGRNPAISARFIVPRLQALRDAGMSYDQIATLANVSRKGISRLLVDDDPKVRLSTAQAILAIEPAEQRPAPTLLVESGATRRRIQALVVHGYPLRSLGIRSGQSRSLMDSLLRRPQVQFQTAEMIRLLYAQLAFRKPAYPDNYARAHAARSSRDARAKGWLGPLDWEDIREGIPALMDEVAASVSGEPEPEPAEIIDEVAIDLFLAGADVSLTIAERSEVILRIIDEGGTETQARVRAGVHSREVKRVLAERAAALAAVGDDGDNGPGDIGAHATDETLEARAA